MADQDINSQQTTEQNAATTQPVDVSKLDTQTSLANLSARRAANESGETAYQSALARTEKETGLSASSFDTEEKRNQLVNSWVTAQQNAARGNNFVKRQQLMETQRKYGITGAVAVAQQEDFALKEKAQMEQIAATVQQNAASQFAALRSQELSMNMSKENAAMSNLSRVVEQIRDRGLTDSASAQAAKDIVAKYSNQFKGMGVNYERIIDDAISGKNSAMDIAGQLRGNKRSLHEQAEEAMKNWGYSTGTKIGDHTIDSGDTDWFIDEFTNKGRSAEDIIREGYKKYDSANAEESINKLISANKIF